MKLHVTKTDKACILLIVILGLLILLPVFYTIWNIGNMLDAEIVSQVFYSPNEEELGVKITITDAGNVNICISIFSSDSPLALIQEIAVSKICLQTAQREYVLDGQCDEKIAIEDGEGNMTISLDAIPPAEFQLKITELTGYAKGEGPLFVLGNWTN